MITNGILDYELNIIKSRILDIETNSIDLKRILQEFLSRESKLIRPLSACLFFKALGENISDEQFKILTATEIVHNASLIHDDVIDGSILRRGKSTINYKYDNKLSVIAGDFLISKAIDELLKLGNNDILKLYFETISKMCEGESYQYFQKDKIPTLEEYLKKTQYKTAELFKACFVSMSLYSKFQCINLAKDFAINFGIAFQIKNDLDDYKIGVENSQDIKDGIYTVPVIYANSTENNITAIEKTLSLIHNYCERLKLLIKDFKDNEYKNSLIEIIDSLCK